MGCCFEFCKIMPPPQYKYKNTNKYKYVKNKVLGVDKLKNMFKKGKVHGEAYCLFQYCQLLFLNVQMITMLPLVLIHKDVPKASLKLFIFSKQQKKRNPLENALNN